MPAVCVIAANGALRSNNNRDKEVFKVFLDALTPLILFYSKNEAELIPPSESPSGIRICIDCCFKVLRERVELWRLGLRHQLLARIQAPSEIYEAVP